jgi:hypothetical protein
MSTLKALETLSLPPILIFLVFVILLVVPSVFLWLLGVSKYYVLAISYVLGPLQPSGVADIA